MRPGVLAAAIAGPCLVVAVGFAVHASPAGTVQGPVPAAHVQTAPAAAAHVASSSGKSHTVAKALAVRGVYHLVPHVHVPYVFRPRIFRRPRLFRRY